MVKWLVVLQVFLQFNFLVQADQTISYNSQIEAENSLVRLVAAVPAEATLVKVTVNGAETVGQVLPAGLNISAKDGEKEVVFVAAKLNKGDNSVTIGAPTTTDAAGFKWQKNDNSTLDLLFADKKMFHYQFAKLDEKDVKTREATYKPYHMVYDSKGEGFITKGPGGKFTHHRGIYYGFAKCSYAGADGKVFKADTWHCHGKAYQSHEEFLSEIAGLICARTTVKINWHGQEGEVFATEIRELSFYFVNGVKVVDFASSLSSELQYVNIDGDPQHAGFQYRSSNFVADKTAKQTYYIRPNEGKDAPGKTKNFPQDKEMTNLLWKAQSCVVEDQRYTICYLDHPGNPKPSFYSERDYGRFGSFFKTKIEPGKPLNIRYRLYIQENELEPATVEQRSQLFLDNFK